MTCKIDLVRTGWISMERHLKWVYRSQGLFKHSVVGGYMKTTKTFWLLLLTGVESLAHADGYVIQTPGQMPTYVNPAPGGGYVTMPPGQMPSYTTPTPGGGYMIQTPGQMPTYVNPTPGGGYTTMPPGQMPSYTTPTPGGGYMSRIYTRYGGDVQCNVMRC